MLVLSRLPGEEIRIRVGDKIIWITAVEIQRGRVLVGITAPKDVEIHRREVVEEIERTKGKV